MFLFLFKNLSFIIPYFLFSSIAKLLALRKDKNKPNLIGRLGL